MKNSLALVRVAVFILAIGIAVRAADTSDDTAMDKAIAALRSGDPAGAEQVLDAVLKAHPNNEPALEVLAVALDQQKKYAEAEGAYRRALVISPHSAGLLNNYGNHLLSVGKTKEAKTAFLQVETLQPRQPNASVQLARMALEMKQPAEADHYLSLLTSAAAQQHDVMLLRMQTDYALHRNAAADALLNQLNGPANDAQQAFKLGVALSSVGQYDKAEGFFAKALESQAENVEMLYDLGLAASHAGHNERARDVLRKVVQEQPDNVNALYDLAAVDMRLKKQEAALEILVRAHQLAPDRADVQFALATAAAEAGYFGDAAKAWAAYITLAPKDDVGRRERAFAETATGENMTAAIADLEAYVQKHPSDAVGHYELGTALAATNSERALDQLNRALELNPQLSAAHVARGLLFYRQGASEGALADFEHAAAEDPQSATILDRLGQTYMALNRTADAVKTFKAARQLAPGDTTILLHLGRSILGRSMSEAGDEQEAAQVFARYRELGGAKAMSRPQPAGLVDFLSLSPEEQQARYRAGVLRTVQSEPDNLEAQIRYLVLLLQDGKLDQVPDVCRKVSSLNPNAGALKEAVGALLNARQYRAAEDLLKPDTRVTASPELQVDRAVALLHTGKADEALALLEGVSASSRTGDYYLARAQTLEALGRSQEAGECIAQALKAKPESPDFYLEGAVLLLSKEEVTAADALLQAAIRNVPGIPDLELLQAAVHSLTGHDTESEYQSMENRWPGWPQLWMTHALVLAAGGHLDKARADARQSLMLAPNDADLQQIAAGINQPSSKHPKNFGLKSLVLLFADK